MRCGIATRGCNYGEYSGVQPTTAECVSSRALVRTRIPLLGPAAGDERRGRAVDECVAEQRARVFGEE